MDGLEIGVTKKKKQREKKNVRNERCYERAIHLLLIALTGFLVESLRIANNVNICLSSGDGSNSSEKRHFQAIAFHTQQHDDNVNVCKHKLSRLSSSRQPAWNINKVTIYVHYRAPVAATAAAVVVVVVVVREQRARKKIKLNRL